MKEVWTKRWKKILIWLSGYLSFIAFAIVGGYTIVKSEDDDLKKETKKALVVTLIFTGISAIFSILSFICTTFLTNYYNSDFNRILNISQNVVTIIKIVVYAVFIFIALFERDNAGVEIENAPKKDSKKEDKTEDAKVEEVKTEATVEEKPKKKATKAKKEDK